MIGARGSVLTINLKEKDNLFCSLYNMSLNEYRCIDSIRLLLLFKNWIESVVVAD